jgi:hypothetical protein
MRFFQTQSTPLVDELTLCSPKMAFAPYLTLSLPTQHEWIYFPNLMPPKDLLFLMQLKLENELLRPTPRQSIPPFSSGGIWMFT